VGEIKEPNSYRTRLKKPTVLRSSSSN